MPLCRGFDPKAEGSSPSSVSANACDNREGNKEQTSVLCQNRKWIKWNWLHQVSWYFHFYVNREKLCFRRKTFLLDVKPKSPEEFKSNVKNNFLKIRNLFTLLFTSLAQYLCCITLNPKPTFSTIFGTWYQYIVQI